jgi:teichuronic acid biosynthesis glycosyltransferase TuaC
MKILMLSKRHYTGKDLVDDRYGRVFEFSRSLALLGHKVQGLAFDYHRRDTGRGASSIREAGLKWDTIRLFPKPVTGIGRYRATISKVAEGFSPDIVLSVSDVYHVLAGDWLAKKIGLVHVVDLYDNYESFAAARAPGVVRLFRRALARADGIVCVSHPLKRFVLDACRPVAEPLVVINAVDTASFFPRDRAECRRHFSLPERGKFVGLGGAIGGDRGVQAVFKAHEILMEQDTDIHLVLAGALQKGTGIPGNRNIHYLGELDYAEMPLFFGTLDTGIIANRDNAFARFCFPQKYFEMVACHTPVSVAATGEVVDMMKSCKQALFQPENEEDMARAIREQLEVPCYPDVEIPSWGQSGAVLSGYLEQLLEARQ